MNSNSQDFGALVYTLLIQGGGFTLTEINHRLNGKNPDELDDSLAQDLTKIFSEINSPEMWKKLKSSFDYHKS